MAILDRSFLFQGMDAERFIQHVEGSFLTPRIVERRIVPTAFVRRGDSAILIAYAETNLGLLPQAADLLPVVGGCEVVRCPDGWRLAGDQRSSPVGIYRQSRSITATVAADDAHLYRRLLPDVLDMPASPVIRLVATGLPRGARGTSGRHEEHVTQRSGLASPQGVGRAGTLGQAGASA